jgi:hypothetical protein
MYMADRRKITSHEIFRDLVSVSTLLAVVTAAIVLGKWIGVNEQKWNDQEEFNREQTVKNSSYDVAIQKLKQKYVIKYQRPFFNDTIEVEVDDLDDKQLKKGHKLNR